MLQGPWAGIMIPVLILLGGVVGFVLGRYYSQMQSARRDQEQAAEAQGILENARAEAREHILSAKSEDIRI